MSPEYVRPYIKAQKNDDRDAEGIAEAVIVGPLTLRQLAEGCGWEAAAGSQFRVRFTLYR